MMETGTKRLRFQLRRMHWYNTYSIHGLSWSNSDQYSLFFDHNLGFYIQWVNGLINVVETKE